MAGGSEDDRFVVQARALQACNFRANGTERIRMCTIFMTGTVHVHVQVKESQKDKFEEMVASKLSTIQEEQKVVGEVSMLKNKPDVCVHVYAEYNYLIGSM